MIKKFGWDTWKNEDFGFKEVSDSILSYVTGHHPGYLGPTTFPVKFTHETEEERRKRLKLFKKAVEGIHEIDEGLYSALEECGKAGNNSNEINNATDKMKKYSKNAIDYFQNLMSNIEGITDNEEHKNYLKTKWKDIFNKTITSTDDVKKALNLHNFFVTIRKALETAEYVENKLQEAKSAESQEVREKHLEDIKKVLNNLGVNADLSEYYNKTSYTQ